VVFFAGYKKTGKKAVVFCLKLLSWQSPGGTEEKDGILN
jgi:hypothetical protein